MTTHEHPQIFLGLPSLSILQRPDHSPNFLLLSTRSNGIWCSLHKAVMSCLYCGSSQLSDRMHRTAWRLREKETVSLTSVQSLQCQVRTWIRLRNMVSSLIQPQMNCCMIKGLFWSFFSSGNHQNQLLTCPKPCMTDGFRGLIHRRSETAWELLGAQYLGP